MKQVELDLLLIVLIADVKDLLLILKNRQLNFGTGGRMKIRQAEKILNTAFPRHKISTWEKAIKRYNKRYKFKKWSELL